MKANPNALLAPAERAVCASLGATHAVAFNNGTSALWHTLCAASAHVARLDAGVTAPLTSLLRASKRQVYVPASCWKRVAPLVAALDADPVLYDVGFDSATSSVQAVADALAKPDALTCATVVVVHHTHGLVCGDTPALASLAARDDVVVIDYADCVPTPHFCRATKGTACVFDFDLPPLTETGDTSLVDSIGVVVCNDVGVADVLRTSRAGVPSVWADSVMMPLPVATWATPLDVRPTRMQGVALAALFGDRFAAGRQAGWDEAVALTRALEDAAAAAAGRHDGIAPFVVVKPAADSALTGAVIVLSRACAHQATALINAVNATALSAGAAVTASPLVDFGVDGFIKVRLSDRAEDCPAAIALGARGVAISINCASSGEVASSLAAAVAAFAFQPRSVILITGAGGMLGRHVRDVLATPDAAATCVGIYVTRKDGDLVDRGDVDRMFARYQPTYVLHCAGMRDGLHGMNARLVDFWQGNVAMNDNVLRAAHNVQRYVGRVKVVSILSTVMFPRDCEYPMTADADRLYAGRQHPAAESYAAAKKALAQVSQWYRMQHGDAFTSIIPGNFYGQYGDFDPKTAPLVNALIARAEAARLAGDTNKLKVLGTGRPLRQVQHARDLARACVWALFLYDEFDPLIVAGAEYSVRQVAEVVCQATGFDGGLEFDEGAVDGPLRRTADTSKFEALCPSHKDMDLLDGIRQTVEWYRDVYGG